MKKQIQVVIIVLVLLGGMPPRVQETHQWGAHAAPRPPLMFQSVELVVARACRRAFCRLILVGKRTRLDGSGRHRLPERQA
jgi:hypothetical protein